MSEMIALLNKVEGDEKAVGQHLSFRCMTTALALPISSVREIIEYGHLTAVPMMPSYVLGVINLRGNVVPVVDLAARFGAGSTSLGKRTCIIILELGGQGSLHLVGLVVDAVDEVLDIEPEQVEPAPAFGTAIRSDFIHGMARRDQGFLILLKADRLLDMESLAPGLEQGIALTTG
ncbi:MAG: chemotaxis protein CheW [Aeromonadaceae bacterium]